MPFDGTDYFPRVKALEKIDQVITLLHSEECWCQGALQKADGRRCILGAMKAVEGTQILTKPILLAIWEVTGREYTMINVYNDRRMTTYPQVMEVLHQARQNIIDRARTSSKITSWYRRLIGAR
jgi:hypothetical protein